MERRLSKEKEDMIRVYRGVFPWSVSEYNWIVATFEERMKNKEEILELTEEFADFKDEMESLTGRELQNFKSMILFGDIFLKRYPKKIEYEAHFYRFHQINRFMQTYHNDLAKLKFVVVKAGKHHIAPQLIDSLCTLLYNQEENDESGEYSCTFSYEEVVRETQAKINMHLN